MVHPRIHDRLAGLDEVVHVIHVVKVPIPGCIVLVHELGLKLQRLDLLGRQRDSGNGAGEDLEISVRTDRLSHFVHAEKGILVDVKVGGLKPRAAPELEMADPGFLRRIGHRGKDVLQTNLASERALEPVAEWHEHNTNFFGGTGVNHIVLCTFHKICWFMCMVPPTIVAAGNGYPAAVRRTTFMLSAESREPGRPWRREKPNGRLGRSRTPQPHRPLR